MNLIMGFIFLSIYLFVYWLIARFIERFEPDLANETDLLSFFRPFPRFTPASDSTQYLA